MSFVILWVGGCGLSLALPLLAGGLAVRVFRGIATPLADADAVTEGDLSVRVPVPVHGPEAFGRLAESFNRMAEELERADQQRRNLTADVAHELHTPLHIIQGNLEGILDDVYEPTEEHIGATLDETRALARAVQGAAWGWPSPGSWCRPTAIESASRANRVRGRRSPSSCRRAGKKETMPDETRLRINDQLSIPLNELRFQFTPSSGPGGQHANRSATRVELLFDVAASPSLSDAQRERVLAALKGYIDGEGTLRLVSQASRSQVRNRQEVTARLQKLLVQALEPHKRRRPTRVPSAERKRRLAEKRRQSEKKRRRRVDRWGE